MAIAGFVGRALAAAKGRRRVPAHLAKVIPLPVVGRVPPDYEIRIREDDDVRSVYVTRKTRRYAPTFRMRVRDGALIELRRFEFCGSVRLHPWHADVGGDCGDIRDFEDFLRASGVLGDGRAPNADFAAMFGVLGAVERACLRRIREGGVRAFIALAGSSHASEDCRALCREYPALAGFLHVSGPWLSSDNADGSCMEIPWGDRGPPPWMRGLEWASPGRMDPRDVQEVVGLAGNLPPGSRPRTEEGWLAFCRVVAATRCVQASPCVPRDGDWEWVERMLLAGRAASGALEAGIRSAELAMAVDLLAPTVHAVDPGLLALSGIPSKPREPGSIARGIVFGRLLTDPDDVLVAFVERDAVERAFLRAAGSLLWRGMDVAGAAAKAARVGDAIPPGTVGYDREGQGSLPRAMARWGPFLPPNLAGSWRDLAADDAVVTLVGRLREEVSPGTRRDLWLDDDAA